MSTRILLLINLNRLLVVGAAVLLQSCYDLTPAGFWATFRKENLIKNQSDQGPWGGHRELYWKSNDKYAFTSAQFIDFASKNGWQFVDSTFFAADRLAHWKQFDKPTFPFTYTNFSDNTMIVNSFPRWMNSDVRVFRFKTGWVAVEPGNARETEINGYVVVNPAETELTVYHRWGE